MPDGREIALGVCTRADRVLLLWRDGPPWPRRWSLPGGKREPGEGFADACRRELREELGTAAEILGLRVLIRQWGEPTRADAAGAWLFAVFACRLAPEAPVPANCRWFPLAAIADLPMLPTDRAFLSDALVGGAWGRFRRCRVRWDGAEPQVVAYG